MKIATILLFLLTLTPCAGNCQPPATSGHTPAEQELQNAVIKILICKYARKYRVMPAAAMAVAHIESRKGGREFRVGRMGRTYWGPMGIHKCFLYLGIDDLERNIEIGVRALARYGPVTTDAALKRVLRKYNTSFNLSYWREIKKAEAKYTQELVDAQYAGNVQ